MTIRGGDIGQRFLKQATLTPSSAGSQAAAASRAASQQPAVSALQSPCVAHAPRKRAAAHGKIVHAVHNCYSTIRNSMCTNSPIVARSASSSAMLAPDNEDILLDLDWKAHLPWLQEMGSCLVAVATAMFVYKLTAKTANSIIQGSWAAVIAAIVWYMLRHVLLEQLYKTRQRVESELADADSEFREVHNLRVHVKVKDALLPSAVRPLAIHCFHGFGANTFSWSLVQDKLARRLGALVTAHDMPGFGLTQRPRTGNPGYLLSFNGHLGRAVMDKELAMRGVLGTDELGATLRKYELKEQAGAQARHDAGKGAGNARVARVLMGHSLGGCCAALEALSSPSDVAALVLVAPAIIAMPSKRTREVQLEEQPPQEPVHRPHPRTQRDIDAASAAPTLHMTDPEMQREPAQEPAKAEGGGVAGATAAVAGKAVARAGAAGVVGAGMAAAEAPAGPAASAPAPAPAPPGTSPATVTPVLRRYTHVPKDGQPSGDAAGPRPTLAQLLALAAACAQGAGMAAAFAVMLALRPFLLVVLRSVVRSRPFWLSGLQAAYYNKSLVTNQVVDAYRKPQLVRGFDIGFVEFLMSRLSFGGNLPQYVQAVAQGGYEDNGLADRFAALVTQHRIPVLIVHGEQDMLVPCSNSGRLARLLPGCELVAISGCGHMPHEELPDEFVDVVEGFLKRVGVLG